MTLTDAYVIGVTMGLLFSVFVGGELAILFIKWQLSQTEKMKVEVDEMKKMVDRIPDNSAKRVVAKKK